MARHLELVLTAKCAPSEPELVLRYGIDLTGQPQTGAHREHMRFLMAHGDAGCPVQLPCCLRSDWTATMFEDGVQIEDADLQATWLACGPWPRTVVRMVDGKKVFFDTQAGENITDEQAINLTRRR